MSDNARIQDPVLLKGRTPQAGRAPVGFEALEDRQLLSAASAIEVELAWLLNQARARPGAYAAATNQPAEVRSIKAQPPLAINPSLNDSAQARSSELATYNYFAHQSVVTGLWPNQIALSAGFQLTSVAPAESNNIESLYGGFPASPSLALEALIRDEGIDPPGHRIHLLATNAFFQRHTEVGVGYAKNIGSDLQNYFTIHTGYEDGSRKRFFTGVTYKDVNKNKRYDAGEGVANVSVLIDGKVAAVSGAAGDYRVQVRPGKHTIAFEGGPFTEKRTDRTFTVRRKNIAYDVSKFRGRQKTYVKFRKTKFRQSKILSPGLIQSAALSAGSVNPSFQTLSVLPAINPLTGSGGDGLRGSVSGSNFSFSLTTDELDLTL